MLRKGKKFKYERLFIVSFDIGFEEAKVYIQVEIYIPDRYNPGIKFYGYIDETGTMVIEEQFASRYPFSEGLASVELPNLNSKEGYIDRNGTIVIEPLFDVAGEFSEGLAYVKEDKDGLYGYIDRSGSYVIEPMYSRAYDFENGYAFVVTKNDGGGYINVQGEMVIKPPKGYGIGEISEGLIIIVKRIR